MCIIKKFNADVMEENDQKQERHGTLLNALEVLPYHNHNKRAHA